MKRSPGIGRKKMTFELEKEGINLKAHPVKSIEQAPQAHPT
jgi:hypothetical protein